MPDGSRFIPWKSYMILLILPGIIDNEFLFVSSKVLTSKMLGSMDNTWLVDTSYFREGIFKCTLPPLIYSNLWVRNWFRMINLRKAIKVAITQQWIDIQIGTQTMSQCTSQLRQFSLSWTLNQLSTHRVILKFMCKNAYQHVPHAC